MSKFRDFKFDWTNHLIGFFSSLLGLYIAFGLENYRESNNEKERVEIAKQAIRKEIQNNLSIYKQNVDELSSWLEHINFCRKKQTENGLVVGANEVSIMVKKHPNRLGDIKKLRNVNDTISLYSWSGPMIDVMPKTGISTSYWRTALASGILSSMDYALTSELSQIYDWTEKDIGASEKELYENFLIINTNDKFTNIDRVISNYSDIVKTSEFKLGNIKGIYSKIKWTD